MSLDRLNAADILKSIPWEGLLESADNFLDDKNKNDNDLDEFIIDQIDDRIDFASIINGPAGAVAEALDGPVIKLVSSLIKALSGDPESRQARREVRKSRREARRLARQERKRARVDE